MSHVLCIGLGYSARPIAARLARRGYSVSATSRSEAGRVRIAAQGYRALAWNPADGVAELRAAAGDLIDSVTHLIVSAPPEAHGDPLLEQHTADLALASRLDWIGYLSTVGVYGDHTGAWVDETTPPAPTSRRSRARLAAEESWLALGRRTGRTVAVLRLAGIYGPGRSAIDQLRAGTARRIVKPGQVFNRIHVEDIATTVTAAIDRNAGGVFNATDDEPAPPQDVVAEAARLLDMAPPPEIAWRDAERTLSEMALSFYAETKRVRNDRIKRELGVALAYPTYREGLAAIADLARDARATTRPSG